MASSAHNGITLRFGQAPTTLAWEDGQLVAHLPCPPLGDVQEETLFSAPALCEEKGDFSILVGKEHCAGIAIATQVADLRKSAYALYSQLLTLLPPSFHFYRIWNYVPQINSIHDELENYRAFNLGRWQAFADQFGSTFERVLPAASAVGIAENSLAIAFIAGHSQPQFLENPQQVPAYRYPEQYGPRPPSFARASLVRETSGAQTLYLSGTSSIRGHATVGEGELAQQCDTTWKNIQILLAEARAQGFPVDASNPTDFYKVYLRHPADAAQIAAFLEKEKIATENTLLLRADICRRELDIEIEAILQR